MKLIHLSDLHLGKRVNDFSMLEEQEAILAQILEIAEGEAPDAILIAGDVYDKSVPTAEAVHLFDGFLARLSERELPVFIISGNHDSPERLAFGARIMERGGIYLSPVYDGHVSPIPLTDAHGTVNIYLLPFVKPAHVRRFFEETEIESYTDAVRTAIDGMQVDTSVRNVLVTHQFVTGSERSESEEISVGGTDNVDGEVFRDFDYVALGHIHRAQNCGSERIRYCGTPLKYSFSEAQDVKSVTVVELSEKGKAPQIRTVGLTPLHDMSELRGSFSELTDPVFAESTPVSEHYLRVTLTDETEVPDAVGRLRSCYPRLMRLEYDNTRTRANGEITGAEEVERKSPFTLFSEFYELQNNAPMTEEQRRYIRDLIEQIGEEQR